ncbi:hypothetical protein ACFL0X_02960 [Nanoarchaeota archaeon]
MSKRQGRIFDLGFPYLSGSASGGLDQGVIYHFPECVDSVKSDGWSKRLEEQRHGLEASLITKLSDYMDEFEISGRHPSIPYSQMTEEGLVLHMMGNGRWISINPQMGGFFLGFHNLDSFSEAVAGFNIGSDTLEFLDESLLCPRIKIREKKYRITYPLPKGEENLPIEKVSALTNPKIFQRWFDIFNLGEATLTEPFGYEFDSGRIKVKNKLVQGEVSNGWKISGTTFVIAKLLDSFRFGS